MSRRVVVYGSINMDLVAGVTRIAAPGETVEALSYATFPGGKGANQALAAHLSGAQVTMLGKVGDDAFGRALLDYYRGKGLPVDDISVSATEPTGTALIQVEEQSGENSIVIVPGANRDFAPHDLDRVAIGRGDIVVSQFEVPPEWIAALFRRAKDAGATTLLNPAPVKPIDEAVLGHADILVVNETELAFLSGEDLAEGAGEEAIAAAARALAGDGRRRVVVTLGRRGVFACTAAGPIRIPGRRVAAVDTTGAGDCFAGTLASALARGLGFHAALIYANAAASLSVQRQGAGPSMPTAAEIEAVVGRAPAS